MFNLKDFLEGFENNNIEDNKVPGYLINIDSQYKLENGDIITIKSGQYYGSNGISNCWEWYNHSKEKMESGYGDFYSL